MRDLQAQLFQFIGHVWLTLIAKGKGALFTDLRQDNQILALALARGRLRNA